MFVEAKIKKYDALVRALYPDINDYDRVAFVMQLIDVENRSQTAAKKRSWFSFEVSIG